MNIKNINEKVNYYLNINNNGEYSSGAVLICTHILNTINIENDLFESKLMRIVNNFKSKFPYEFANLESTENVEQIAQILVEIKEDEKIEISALVALKVFLNFYDFDNEEVELSVLKSKVLDFLKSRQDKMSKISEVIREKKQKNLNIVKNLTFATLIVTLIALFLEVLFFIIYQSLISVENFSSFKFLITLIPLSTSALKLVLFILGIILLTKANTIREHKSLIVATGVISIVSLPFLFIPVLITIALTVVSLILFKNITNNK